MTLMPRLILSLLPFALGYLSTTGLSWLAQLQISPQVEEIKSKHLVTMELAYSMSFNFEMGFVKLNDLITQVESNPGNVSQAQKSAQDVINEALKDLASISELQARSGEARDSEISKIRVIIEENISLLIKDPHKYLKASGDEDPLWKFYKDYEVLNATVETLKKKSQSIHTKKMDRITEEVSNLFVRSFIMFIIVFLVSTTLVYLSLSRGVVSPIRETTQMLEQMSLGRLSLRMKQSRVDEIGRMHHALNRFATQLEEKIARLRKIIEGDLTSEVQLTSEDDDLGKAMNETIQSLKQSHDQLTQEVTQHKQSKKELEETQAHLIQSEKMSSLGQLVAGVAHEINNPVNFLQSNFYAIGQSVHEVESLLWEILPEDEEAREIRAAFSGEFEKIKRYEANHKVGTKRLGDIVSSLKSFTRHDQADIQHVSLREILNDTLMILHHKTKQIDLQLKIESDQKVYCHPSQLGQVFLNLISNAIYAAERAHQEDDERPRVVVTISEDQEGYSSVKVSDNGDGIPAEMQSKIFDPFFTTKPVGEGTGLGLSICYRIIESHQGHLRFTSDESGTTFCVQLSHHALAGDFTN